MLEVNVTKLVERVDDMIGFSGSQMEWGPDAGPITWRNSQKEAKERPLVEDKDLDEIRSWARGFGAWDDDEIAAMTPADLNALLLQFIAGDIREADGLGFLEDEEEYKAAVESGRVSGNLYKGDDGQWYYSVD